VQPAELPGAPAIAGRGGFERTILIALEAEVKEKFYFRKWFLAAGRRDDHCHPDAISG
jgi:hypothetical protein